MSAHARCGAPAWAAHAIGASRSSPSRLLFEPPTPAGMLPSLMILVAPAAVGFSGYVVTIGRVDLFAESLYALTLFLLAVLSGRLRHLGGACPFGVSWWAMSFPRPASAIAALRFAASDPSRITDAIALAVLAYATLVILGLLARTLFGIPSGELRTLSG